MQNPTANLLDFSQPNYLSKEKNVKRHISNDPTQFILLEPRFLSQPRALNLPLDVRASQLRTRLHSLNAIPSNIEQFADLFEQAASLYIAYGQYQNAREICYT